MPKDDWDLHGLPLYNSLLVWTVLWCVLVSLLYLFISRPFSKGIDKNSAWPLLSLVVIWSLALTSGIPEDFLLNGQRVVCPKIRTSLDVLLFIVAFGSAGLLISYLTNPR